MKSFRYKKDVIIAAIFMLTVITWPLYKSLSALIFYPYLKGFEKGVFGYPTPLREILFKSFFWTLYLFGILLFMSNKKASWYILSACNVLLLAYSIFGWAVTLAHSYWDFYYFANVFFSLFLLYYLNTNTRKASLLNGRPNFIALSSVIFGLVIIGLVCAIYS